MTEAHVMTPPGTPAIILSRLFAAPRSLVFKAFTDPVDLPNWWGPEGFTNIVHSIDIRTGGEWHFIMRGPDGTEYPNRIMFHEISKPEKIVYAHDSGEARDDDTHSFMTTVTFEEHLAGTLVTMTSVFRDEKTRDAMAAWGAIDGGKSTLAKLAAYLETMP